MEDPAASPSCRGSARLSPLVCRRTARPPQWRQRWCPEPRVTTSFRRALSDHDLDTAWYDWAQAGATVRVTLSDGTSHILTASGNADAVVSSKGTTTGPKTGMSFTVKGPTYNFSGSTMTGLEFIRADGTVAGSWTGVFEMPILT